ncbi:hypothetical protein CC86DRAFT_403117 [Ophiobolus disseminans]|uniref:SRR1-like domain-containing protein n=1 Tax=Ophiobolus disseminans TaxID=1469910 RepID=A0A6A7AAA4_9PLEO|nr:hypothetical protein CC86DRAFT_403117 [Ophiobolus disseminans]
MQPLGVCIIPTTTISTTSRKHTYPNHFFYGRDPQFLPAYFDPKHRTTFPLRDVEIFKVCDKASSEFLTMDDLDKVLSDIEQLTVTHMPNDDSKGCKKATTGGLELNKKADDDIRPTTKTVDIEAFLETVSDRPLYARQYLQHAFKQFERARSGINFQLMDSYGTIHNGVSKLGHQTSRDLLYSLRLLADPTPYSALKLLSPRKQVDVTCDMYDTVDKLIHHSKFPVYVHFANPDCRPEYEIFSMHCALISAVTIWNQSSHLTALRVTLDKLKDLTRITNIICIGHGSFARSERSVVQHVVASWIASTLTEMYGITSEPVRVIAQDPACTRNDPACTRNDPACTRNDITLLSRLPTPIEVVSDLHAFLTINSSSLVMSHPPSIPVKAVVADLSDGPAVLFWGRNPAGKIYQDVNRVKISVMPGTGEFYFVDAYTRRVTEILEQHENMTQAANTNRGWCREDDWAEDGNGRYLNWTGNKDMWVKKV